MAIPPATATHRRDFANRDLPVAETECDSIRLMSPSRTAKEAVTIPVPPPSAAGQTPEQPVRTMSMEKATKLIRKTSTEHEDLFRRLAK